MGTCWRKCSCCVFRSLGLPQFRWGCVNFSALATYCHASMPWWTLPLPPPPRTIIQNKLFQELLLIVAFYHSNKWQIDCYLWSWGSCELLGSMLGVSRYQAALQSWRPCTLNKDTLRKAPTVQSDLRGHIWCSCANISLFPEEVHFYLYKHLSAVLKAAKRVWFISYFIPAELCSNLWRRGHRPIKKMTVLLHSTGDLGKGHFETCFII